jgi:hypothetical protein
MLREIKRLPEKEVIHRWMMLYVAGKHAGFKGPDASVHLGKDPTWVEVEIPHELYNADWNTEDTDLGLSGKQLERATKYAATPGPLPPGMASFNARTAKRGGRKVFVTDGNHRAYAAFLRGDPAARFYMPLNDWERFRAAVG